MDTSVRDSPASVDALRDRASDLLILASEIGLKDLALGGPGQLVAHVPEDVSYLRLSRFEVWAEQLVGAHVTVSDYDEWWRTYPMAPVEPLER